MLGEDLLVAPIFNEEGSVDFYVPEGKWTNYLTNEVYQGLRFYEQTYDYMHLPLLVKPNTILAEGSVNDRAVYDYADAVTLHIFELAEGAQAETSIFTKDGDLVSVVKASRQDDTITIAAPGLSNFNVLLRNVSDFSANTTDAKAHDLGTLISGLANEVSITLN